MSPLSLSVIAEYIGLLRTPTHSLTPTHTHTCVSQTRHNQSLNPKTHTKRSFQLKFRFHSLSQEGDGMGDGE